MNYMSVVLYFHHNILLPQWYILIPSNTFICQIKHNLSFCKFCSQILSKTWCAIKCYIVLMLHWTLGQCDLRNHYYGKMSDINERGLILDQHIYSVNVYIKYFILLTGVTLVTTFFSKTDVPVFVIFLLRCHPIMMLNVICTENILESLIYWCIVFNYFLVSSQLKNH